MDDEDRSVDVAVFRCESCGDTFPSSSHDDVRCPSCGGGDVHLASEPLL